MIGILALMIAVFNEDKILFYWSAYNSLLYANVDQWLVIKEILKISEQKWNSCSHFLPGSSYYFFLKYMEGFLVVEQLLDEEDLNSSMYPNTFYNLWHEL